MSKKIYKRFAYGVSGFALAASFVAPSFAYAATTSTTVKANIGSTISVSDDTPTVNLTIIPTAGGSATSASDTVTVTTNDANGYKLSISGATTTLSTASSDTLEAVTGTPTTPSAVTSNTWGYRWDDSTAGTGFGAGPTSAQTNATSLTSTKWAGMTTSPVEIKSTAAAATSGDATEIWYGAMADTSKPSGIYSDVITYTAVGN